MTIRRLFLHCSLCGNEIPDGKQVCVWGDQHGALTVCFICEQCSELPGFEDITEEIMGEE
jgi:hypothetical protein